MRRTHYPRKHCLLGVIIGCVMSMLLQSITGAQESDWPRWRGPRGDGSWQGSELPTRWPEQGLPVVWRQSIGGGYAGVIVADGRVYVMDRQTEPESTERVLCFDADTGTPLWESSYPVDYGDLTYDSGPRAAPTVADGQIYTLGAVGHLCCLDAVSGQVLWQKDTVAELKAQRPMWGFAASPVIWQNLVIVHIGAQPDGCLVAFDRNLGHEIWRASADPAGYCTPTIIEHQGTAQLICWNPENIFSVSPTTGEMYWSLPYKVTNGVSIAAPIFHEGLVFVSGYWEGAKAIQLGNKPQDATLLWEENEFLRALMAQPLYRDGYAYLLDKQHGLTCFRFQTGEKLWDDGNRMTPKGRHPQATMVWTGNADQALVLNSDGELILARFTPDGYLEQSRTALIDRTWAHPAYSGNRIYARSDTELICAQLTE